MNQVRVGFIGLGGIATRMHLPALKTLPAVSIQAGAEINSYQAERTQQRFNIPRVYDSYQRMFDEEELEAVYVCLPNTFHAAAVRCALEHNVHVFCEKPMGVSAPEAVSLAQLAEARGRYLMPGYNMRYVLNYRRARDLIRGKRLGRILQIQATMAKPGPYAGWDPKSDWYFNPENFGVLFDQGSHAIDLIRFISGVEIVDIEIMSTISLPGLEVPDSIVATFRTDTDAVGTLNLTWGACANLDMVTVHGTAGTVIASWNYFEHLKSIGGGVAKMTTFAANSAAIVRRVSRSILRLRDTSDPYVAINQEFINAICHGTSPSITAWDGVRVLEVLGKLAEEQSAMIRMPV
jgi:UDP-N-acetylglucosamine 3-dehydrogenase